MLRLRFHNDAIRNAIVAMEVVADRHDLAHLYVGKATSARPSDYSEYGLVCGLVGPARLIGLRIVLAFGPLSDMGLSIVLRNALAACLV